MKMFLDEAWNHPVAWIEKNFPDGEPIPEPVFVKPGWWGACVEKGSIMANPLTIVDLGIMIKGYEQVVEVLDQAFYDVQNNFPVCEDPSQRKQELLSMIDQLGRAGIDNPNLRYYRLLCETVENLRELSIMKRNRHYVPSK